MPSQTEGKDGTPDDVPAPGEVAEQAAIYGDAPERAPHDIREPVPGSRDEVPGSRNPAPPDGNGEPHPSEMNRLFSYIADLERRVSDRERQDREAATSAAIASPGGPPVPHDLVLQDGTFVPGHEGLATHYTSPDGSIKRVIAAYPVVMEAR